MRRRHTGTVRLRVEGLSLEKLLNLCRERGIRLSHVRRESLRAVQVTLLHGHLQKFSEIADARGWKATVLDMRGPVVWAAWMRRRVMLVCGAIVFLALSVYATNCIWQVDIVDAGPYAGEVRTVLAARGIGVGRLFWQVDLEGLKNELQTRLTGLSWAGVSREGVRLVVRCVQGDFPTEVEQGGAPGDVTARVGGVVKDLRVIAGTAKVKIGDVVRAGQVLIEGVERTSKGETRPVHARGSVTARVWVTGRAVVPLVETLTEPTGNVTERRVFATPWIEFSLTDAPVYENVDQSDFIAPMGGLLPIWTRLERYEEVAYREAARDENEVRDEAEHAALRIAREKAGSQTQIVDKWANYCMIEEGYWAEVVLETAQEIAQQPLATE